MRDTIVQAGLVFDRAAARARGSPDARSYGFLIAAPVGIRGRRYIATPPDFLLGAALVLSCGAHHNAFAESWWEWFSVQTICDVRVKYGAHDPMVDGDDCFREPYLCLKASTIRYFELLKRRPRNLPLDWPVEAYADCFHALGLQAPLEPPAWLTSVVDWPRYASAADMFPEIEDEAMVRASEEQWSTLSRQLSHHDPRLRRILETVAHQSIPIVDQQGAPLLVRDLIYLRLRKCTSLRDLESRLRDGGCVSIRRKKGKRAVRITQNNLSKINARYVRQPLRELCRENLELLGVDGLWLQGVAPRTEFNEQLFPPLPRPAGDQER